jgi:hypothetical protein
LKQRFEQNQNLKSTSAQTGTIPSKIEIDRKKQLQFFVENKPETVIESRTQPVQLYHLTNVETDSVDFVQMWEMDPEDDDSFANDIDSMPLDTPPESPFENELIPRTSTRDDHHARLRNPRGPCSESVLLHRERSIRSLEYTMKSSVSPLRASERSRHSVKSPALASRSAKYEQGSERSCSSRPERLSSDRSSCHDRRDPYLNSSQHTAPTRSVAASTSFRENHGSGAGMRDITYERSQQDKSARSEGRDRTSSSTGSISGQESERYQDRSERKFQMSQSERWQRSLNVANPSKLEFASRSPFSAKFVVASSGTIIRQGQPPACSTLESVSCHRPRTGSTTLNSMSQHRSPSLKRGPEVEARSSRREIVEGETPRPRSRSVPKRTTVKSSSANGNPPNMVIVRKPLEEPKPGSRFAVTSRQQDTKEKRSKKVYLDSVFGMGAHSYHEVSPLSRPYKNAPAG